MTENRKEDGLVLCRSIMENTVLPSTYMNAKNGILQKRAESDIATEMCRKLRVKTPSYEKSSTSSPEAISRKSSLPNG